MLHRRAAVCIALSAALTTMLSGCGGSSDAVPSGTLNVTPALGLVENGEVTVLNASGTVLGSGSTGTSGTAAVKLYGSTSGPIVVKLSLTTSSKYFNEATGQMVTVPAAATLLSIAPSLPTSNAVGVTALTNMAAKLAGVTPSNLGTISSLNLSATTVTNAVAKTVLALGLPTTFNILAAPVPASTSNPNPTDTYGKLLKLLGVQSGASGSNPLDQALGLANAVTISGSTITLNSATLTQANTLLQSVASSAGITVGSANATPSDSEVAAAASSIGSLLTSGSAPTGATGGTGATGATGASGSLSSQ